MSKGHAGESAPVARPAPQGRLSERLLRVAAEVPAGGRVVDVGSDHALLPIHLVRTGKVRYAVATDRAPGPCAAARDNVARNGLAGVIPVRCGPGLTTVRPGEVDTIVIAGLGGYNTAGILAASPDVVTAASRVVLQPMSSHGVLRRTLNRMGLALRREAVFAEAGRLYVLVVADWQGDPDAAYRPWAAQPAGTDLAFELGPLLLHRPTPEFLEFARDTLQRWTRIAEAAGLSRASAGRSRQREVAERIDGLRHWLAQQTSRSEGR